MPELIKLMVLNSASILSLSPLLIKTHVPTSTFTIPISKKKRTEKVSDISNYPLLLILLAYF